MCFHNGETVIFLPYPSDQTYHPLLVGQPRIMSFLILYNMKNAASLKPLYLMLCLYHRLEEDKLNFTMKKQSDQVSVWDSL